jgi:hypothetical protein
VVGCRTVEIMPRRKLISPAVLVESLSGDPGASWRRTSASANELERIPQCPRRLQADTREPKSQSCEMNVAVSEPRHRETSTQIDDARARAAQGVHLSVTADGEDTVAADGEAAG